MFDSYFSNNIDLNRRKSKITLLKTYYWKKKKKRISWQDTNLIDYNSNWYIKLTNISKRMKSRLNERSILTFRLIMIKT